MVTEFLDLSVIRVCKGHDASIRPSTVGAFHPFT
jgi:hypothetical protein